MDTPSPDKPAEATSSRASAKLSRLIRGLERWIAGLAALVAIGGIIVWVSEQEDRKADRRLRTEDLIARAEESIERAAEDGAITYDEGRVAQSIALLSQLGAPVSLRAKVVDLTGASLSCAHLIVEAETLTMGRAWLSRSLLSWYGTNFYALGATVSRSTLVLSLNPEAESSVSFYGAGFYKAVVAQPLDLQRPFPMDLQSAVGRDLQVHYGNQTFKLPVVSNLGDEIDIREHCLSGNALAPGPADVVCDTPPAEEAISMQMVPGRDLHWRMLDFEPDCQLAPGIQPPENAGSRP